jgi:hypothetical protein
MTHRLILLSFLLLWLALNASQCNAQATGSLAYDLYNGTTFDQRTLAPVEGKVLGWSGGVLTNVTPASGGTWGSITGTLASQEDLQTALDAKLTVDGDGSALTGITASQVGAIADGDTVASLTFFASGLGILDGTQAFKLLLLGSGNSLTANRTLSLNVNDGDRTLNLFGNLTVPATATVSNTNTGDITLTGTGGYLSLTGQALSRSLINLGSHVTGTLPVANGGTGDTTHTANSVLLGNGTSPLLEVAPGTSGNVLTSNGTTWQSTAPTGTTYATDLQARQGISTTTAIAPATLWSAVHDSLFTADFSRFISTTVTGSGLMVTTSGNPYPSTGATANSTARGQWITQAKSGASGWGNMDFSRPSSFGLTVMRGSGTVSSTGIFRVWFGTDTNASSIAARGYGFEIREYRVWIIAHNGTTLVAQDTGTDISSTSFVLNVMRCVNDGAGNISVFMNNAQIGTALAGGPTTAGTSTLNILNLNGATATANDIRTLAGTFTANVY